MLHITAGLGAPDDYCDYVQSGADEVFCGFVPQLWQKKYSTALPINRREVRYALVQVGGEADLLLLAERQKRLGAPLAVAFNALYYIQEQYPLLIQTMEKCIAMGIDRFIVADPSLVYEMHQAGLMKRCSVHLSGEMGTMNRETAILCRDWGVKRIIFHRKTALADMANIIRAVPEMEYEAFALNENCHFHGGFCFSLHADEVAPMCRVPYRLVTDGTLILPKAEQDGPALQERAEGEMPPLGITGCGLCALWQMKNAGITCLKLVGRGNWPDVMNRDIRALRTAALLAEEAESEAEYIKAMKQALFPSGCTTMCYYGKE